MKNLLFWRLMALACVTVFAQAKVVLAEEEFVEETRLSAAQERLGLREDQVEPFREAMSSAAKNRAEILRRHGVSKDNNRLGNLRKLRKARPELRAVRDELDVELAGILDAEQMDTFQELRQELAAAAREKGKAAR